MGFGPPIRLDVKSPCRDVDCCCVVMGLCHIAMWIESFEIVLSITLQRGLGLLKFHSLLCCNVISHVVT